MPRGCVITIIAASLVMLAISILYYFFFWPDHQRKGTSMGIHSIEKAMADYREDYGELPGGSNGDIAGLLLGDNPREKEYLSKKSVVLRDGELVDFWKRPLRFGVVDGEPVVISAGRNGEFGDADDITSQLVKDMIELHRERNGDGDAGDGST